MQSMRDGNLGDGKELKCYISCVLEMMNMVSRSGVLRPFKNRKYLEVVGNVIPIALPTSHPLFSQI